MIYGRQNALPFRREKSRPRKTREEILAPNNPTPRFYSFVFISEPIAFFLSIRCYGDDSSLSLSPLCLVSFFSPQRTFYLLNLKTPHLLSLPPLLIRTLTTLSYRSLVVFKSYEDIERPLLRALAGRSL